MSIKILWEDLEIVRIEKIENLYFSKVDIDNLQEARDKGFPVYLLKRISLVSDELLPIIQSRLPLKVKNQNKLKFKGYNGSEDIISYINETGLKRPTDKISIRIDIE